MAWRIAAAVLCMIVVAATAGAVAKVIEPLIDRVFTNREQAALWPIALIVMLVFLARGLATYGESILMNSVSRRIIARLQEEMFGQLLQADLATFHATAAGKLTSRFTSDCQHVQLALAGGLIGLGRDGLSVIVLVGVMFSLDVTLTAVAFFAFPAAMFPIVRLGRRMRKVTRSTQVEYGELTAALVQTFQGIRHVKAYNAEAHEQKRVGAIIWKLARLIQKAARIRYASHPIMEVLGGMAFVAIILYGGSQVIAGTRTTGSFFAFITALLLAYEPMKRLAHFNVQLQQGLSAAERIFAMIDARPTILDRPDARVLDRVAGRIVFDQVHFSYGRAAPALHGVSLEVPAGCTVALVGPSGAGKSSVLNLIPRFYDVGAGAVLIDGHDVRDVTLASLREQIALVSQETTLFDDSVRANIAYGRPGASAAEIEAAATSALAHDFVTALPNGYDTLIGENGVRLSGGQRQRLSIARAMLKDAPILLLDEATSALDAESERQVQEALRRLMTGRTTLVIAHRLATVRDADLIHVMEAGRVIETGTHAQLVRRRGLYARLWSLQTEATEPPRAVGA